MSKTYDYLVTTGNKRPAVRLQLPSLSAAEWAILYDVVRIMANRRKGRQPLDYAPVNAWELEASWQHAGVHWHEAAENANGMRFTLLPAVEVGSKTLKAVSRHLRVNRDVARIVVVQPSKMLSAEEVMGEFKERVQTHRAKSKHGS